MSIERKLFYLMHCDSCHLCLNDEGTYFLVEERIVDIQEAAEEMEWKCIKGRWLCPDCQEKEASDE